MERLYRSRRTLRIAALMGMATLSAVAQPAAFEVASVKVSPPRTGTAGFTAMDSNPAMVRYLNIRLKILISIAYQCDDDRILGVPPSLDSVHYDVIAKLPPGTPKDQVPILLQALLAERFKLTLHRESTEQRVYFLVIGKNGPKLKEGQPDGGQSVMIRGGIMGPSMSMAMLSGMLSRFMGYRVIDKTGLAGTFDIDLRWTPGDAGADGVEVLAAVQDQLGLKLESGRAPVEILKIDHAEQVPLEN